METLPLGRTGEHVSALCLGAMYFGSTTDEPTSRKLLNLYMESGGRFIDTANAYARWVPGCQGGESEALLGRWMKEKGNRSEIFLASKVGFPAPVDSIEFGLSASQIKAACDASLKRLGTDHIDLYYSHNDDRRYPLEERLVAFNDLVKSGKVRYIGASNTVDWRIEEARWVSQTKGISEYCCIQQRYSYARPQAGSVYDPHAVVNDELLDYSRIRGLTLLAYSPLLGGAYVRTDKQFPPEYQGPDLERRMTVLRKVAGEAGATLSQLVLAWLVRSEPHVIPLVAASTEEQLVENLESLAVKVSPEQLEELSQAGNTRQENPFGQRNKVQGLKEG